MAVGGIRRGIPFKEFRLRNRKYSRLNILSLASMNQTRKVRICICLLIYWLSSTKSASNTESSAATIAYLEYCERTCRRYYGPWTKTRKLINLSLLSAHDDDSADEIERHRIAGRKDIFVLDLFTSLIVTSVPDFKGELTQSTSKLSEDSIYSKLYAHIYCKDYQSSTTGTCRHTSFHYHMLRSHQVLPRYPFFAT
jgi:hypothetical protein